MNYCPSCNCTNYLSKGMENIASIERAIAGLNSTKEVVEFMLKNIPEFKDLNNKDFVFTYWHFTAGYVVPPAMRKMLTDPETIRRVKQKLVETNPEFEPSQEVQIEKIWKKYGVEEWVTSG